MIDEKLEFFLDEDPEVEQPTEETKLENEKEVLEETKEEDTYEEEEEVFEENETIEEEVVLEEDVEYMQGIYEYLKEQKVLNLPDDYEFEPTEEGLQAALDASKNSIKDSLYDSLYDEMPPQGKELIEFFKSGGQDVSQFIQMYQEPNYEEIAVEDEEIAKALIYNHYKKTTRFTDERIEKEIRRLENSNELLEEGEVARQELAKNQESEREALKKKAAEQKEERQKQLEEAKKSVEDVLKTRKIKGIQIDEKEAKALESVIFTPVKTESGVTTNLMIKLQKALSNPEDLLLLAKLADEDFNLDFLVPQAKVKAGKDLSKKLKTLQAKKLTRQTKGSSTPKLDTSGGITLG